ncbi:MAG: S-layer homology domain-containing protein [Deltaproteobacteria bacterium]
MIIIKLGAIKRFSLVAVITAIIILNLGAVAIAEETAGKAKTSVSTSPYTDVAVSDPNLVFIKYISQRGILTGFPDGTYHPGQGLTRAQAAVVICKAAGLQTPPAGTSRFTDVPTEHWALNYISAAEKAGYLGGFPDGTFRPEVSLSRAQGISLVMRLCTQKDLAPLPEFNDMNQSHWAAASMGTALALDMIGRSADGKNIYPDAEISRGSLARALAILITKDPGLNQVKLEGRLSEITGQVALLRDGQKQTLRNELIVIEGDRIETGADSSVRITYPDGTSTLVEANSALVVKQSDGCRYIKIDGSQGVAVDFLNLALDEGSIYSAVATKHIASDKSGTDQNEPDSENKTGQIDRQIAALDVFNYLAAADDKAQNQAWYKTAQSKKVKVKVDMPWGIAAIRGTYVKITVNPDRTCRVSCLGGDAQLTGFTGDTVTLNGSDTASVKQEGDSASKEGTMDSDDKEAFSEVKVQVFFIDASVEQDVNQSAEITPSEAQGQTYQDAESAVQAVIDALKTSGIELESEAVEELQDKIQEQLDQMDEKTAKELQTQAEKADKENNQPANNSKSESSSGSDVMPATAPQSIVLEMGSAHPVGGVTNVGIPAANGTDTAGSVHGWVNTTAANIRFTVTDKAPASSTITIDGVSYTSGTDYIITAASPLTIVVTTSKTFCETVVRTFVVEVLAANSSSQITATAYGTLVDGNIAEIPAGTLVSDFKAGLTVSDYATVEILTASGSSAVADQSAADMTSTMVMQVTAEDGSIAEYEIYDYAVANLDELYGAVTSGLAARYILAADLDFNNPSSYASGSTNQAVWTSGYGWKPPAGNFIGVFEGNGHSISHLHIAHDQGPAGLFPIVENGALIKNLAVLDADVGNVVCDTQRYGVLAGYLGNGAITDCYCSGSINAFGAVGGIVGHTDSGANIIRCKSAVNVTGNWCVGGIVGRMNTGGTIQDCCSTGNITCFRECAGGIAGTNGYNGVIGNSYATGAVNANRLAGGISGDNGGTVNNCLALNSRVSLNSGSETSVGRICGHNVGTVLNSYAFCGMVIAPASGYTGYDGNGAITLADAKSQASYSGFMAWDVADVNSPSTSAWLIDDGKMLPFLRCHYQPSSSKEILASAYGSLVEGNLAGIPAGTKVSDLKAGLIVSDYASVEVLDELGGSPVADPATTDVSSSMAVRVTAEDGSTADYEIYDSAITFLEDLYNIPDGSTLRYLLARDLDFDSDVSYATPATNKTAWTSGGGWARNLYFKGLLEGNGHSISNLYINDSAATKGLFSSVNTTAIVRNLRLLDVDISGTGGEQRYGAISGHFSGASIINCYASGRVYNPGGGATGGLVGHCDSGTIIGCRSDVNVTGNWGVGGIVGRNCGAALQDCSSYGNVTCNYESAGGLVGVNQGGSVIRSFAAGIISGPRQIGGLIGYNQAVVNGCFALNSKIMINSGAEVSIGHISGNVGGTCSDCYYLTDMVMLPATGTSGSDGAGVITLSETKQANTYSAKGWEIAGIGGTLTSTWAINEGNNYPDLRWYSRLSSAKAVFATSIGTLVGGNIASVPSGTKVLDLKRSISVSKYASLEILDSSGGSPVANQATTDVTTSMVIRVTAQDGSEAEYTISG